MKIGTEALSVYIKHNKNARKTLLRIEVWDTDKSLKENAIDIGVTYQTAIEMSHNYKLGHK